ncbi:Uma2 family endonuclease [Streptomyces sp. NPDC057011]|uniref:Uma2 family endonuclease n=1 Tax=unclassified Streptomyces TaxID=2593676 RepID=UPI0036354E63
MTDPERALKYAVQPMADDHVEVIEGRTVRQSRAWGDEASAASVRHAIQERVGELGCFMGSGDLDLPGSQNWYVPDIAVVPKELAKGGGALLPDQTLLIVEVTSESTAETDRVVKRRRYAEYGAPLYLLIDRVEGTVTLFSEPGRLGYTRTEGPHPFGTTVRLPEPFGIELDTSEL